MDSNKTKLSLKTIREIKKMTQKEAAKLIGISVDTLSNYERGKTFPDVTNIKKIEAAYGVTYDQIIFLPQNIGLTDI